MRAGVRGGWLAMTFVALARRSGSRGWGRWGRGCCFLAAPLLLVSLPAPLHSNFIPSYAGPFIAYAKSFRMCPPNAWDIDAREGDIPTVKLYWRVSHFNPKRPRELQTVTGNITNHADVRDNLWTKVTMATRSNNEWKENAFVFNFPKAGCSALRAQVPLAYRAMFDQDPYSKEDCVIRKGFYVYDKKPMNWTFPNFPVMPYGHWRFRVMTGLQGSKIKLICVDVDCVTIPAV